MLYIIVFVVLVVAILVVYISRVAHQHSQRRKAHQAQQSDPENVTEVGPRPTLRETANDVTHRMFPTTADRRPEARDEGYVTRIDQERFRRGYGEAVNRVEEDVGERDNDLPSYQDSAKMPRAPPAVYDAASAHPTASRQASSQQSLPTAAPPTYTESPIVRRL